MLIGWVQVLAKASKVIPVMLMGRLVSRRSYSWGEYGTAGLTSLGLFLFLLTSGGTAGGATRVTTLSGTIILAGYLAFDSFTSNWQGELFRTYRMSSIEMMAGVNFFSVLLTSVSLLQQACPPSTNFILLYQKSSLYQPHPSLSNSHPSTNLILLYQTSPPSTNLIRIR